MDHGRNRSGSGGQSADRFPELDLWSQDDLRGIRRGRRRRERARGETRGFDGEQPFRAERLLPERADEADRRFHAAAPTNVPAHPDLPRDRHGLQLFHAALSRGCPRHDPGGTGLLHPALQASVRHARVAGLHEEEQPVRRVPVWAGADEVLARTAGEARPLENGPTGHGRQVITWLARAALLANYTSARATVRGADLSSRARS